MSGNVDSCYKHKYVLFLPEKTHDNPNCTKHDLLFGVTNMFSQRLSEENKESKEKADTAYVN